MPTSSCRAYLRYLLVFLMAGVTIAAAATAAKAAPLRTLIIGSGVTGAALASALTRLAREDGRPLIATTLFDKGRAPGGRMTTTRAVGEAAGSRADSGAQYLTETAHSKHRGQYDALAAAGVIKPVDGVILGQREAQRKLRNFVAPAGIASVVRHMLSSATTDAAAQGVPLTVVQSKEVRRIEVTADAASGAGSHRPSAQWAVTCADGSVATFDAVIVTIPTPQIMKLEGDVPALLEGSGASPGVAAVRYSSRYALVAYYGAETWATVHASLPYVGACCCCCCCREGGNRTAGAWVKRVCAPSPPITQAATCRQSKMTSSATSPSTRQNGAWWRGRHHRPSPLRALVADPSSIWRCRRGSRPLAPLPAHLQ